MHILIFSIVPLFPHHDMGGAQKHLRHIANHLGEHGHSVTILCTRREDTPQPFRWHENVLIKPILAFKQPFPSPYDTGAHNLATIVQDVVDHLQTADRFYIHDGEFILPYVYAGIPTVIGLRDNVYPETILGSFLFQAHRLIVISPYAKRFVQATAGRFFPELDERLTLIPNGIDWTHFQPTPPQAIRALIPFDPAEHALILHPHRPEPSKGLLQSLRTLERIVKHHRLSHVRLLVPKWLNVAGDAGVQAFYEQAQAEIQARGLADYVYFHDWIPQHLLPEYYSMGAVTLSLGHFVESFGNAVYESLGCGTPSIAARVATHRELLPDELLHKVDFDDTDSAADLAAHLITTRARTSPLTRDYLAVHYSTARQLAAYADVIENAQLASPMRYAPQPRTAHTRYRLAPWCYLSPRGIYHDFLATYTTDAALLALIAHYPDGFTWAQALENTAPDTLEAWYRAGYVVSL